MIPNAIVLRVIFNQTRYLYRPRYTRQNDWSLRNKLAKLLKLQGTINIGMFRFEFVSAFM